MSEVRYLHPPVVWLLTDGKPGHRNQLVGLGNRLQALAEAKLTWINASRHPVPLWRALLGLAAPMGYPKPDIIAAAGTGTHRLLLSLRRCKAMTVVLMRPSFPAGWVSAAVIPAHDHPSPRPGVLVTQGVLNAVIPQKERTSERQGLVMVGGPSRHFVWDDETVYEQIAALCKQFPDWNWSITSSRRTPASFAHRLTQASLPNVTFYPHEETEPGWVESTLSRARVVWVSPDSATMVYEALTSGVPTGLLELEPMTHSRVAQSILDLERQGYLAPWTDRMALLKADRAEFEPLWEADRAARWVLQEWQRQGLWQRA